ncbi:MRN complex-interacting protein-like isoform X6 [Zingiber officinale]|uniref:MRN complex-interacting protein-like isoform X6 n=1 Tax=Zingiber officinale TaxID=94328 RepID=UPI001C4B4444|nr:MRN complex-interacting protein-like isoform X6 [Zingiber officinale]
MARQRFSFKIPEAGERTWEWRAIKSVAMATLFIALQCCNCSTMQVKQQRKGTISKWVCAVCNQRQSVRRIHARGPLARDLREFVQDFNMARAAAEADLGNPNPPLSRAEDDPFSVSKRRTDWSEYLDLEADLDGIEQGRCFAGACGGGDATASGEISYQEEFLLQVSGGKEEEDANWCFRKGGGDGREARLRFVEMERILGL